MVRALLWVARMDAAPTDTNFGVPANAGRTGVKRTALNQLLLINLVLALAAVTACLGVPAIPAFVGALGGGATLFIGYRVLVRPSGHPGSRSRTIRAE